MEMDNKNISDQQDFPNLDNNRIDSSFTNNSRRRPSALRCELELIPVIAGECRAEPTSITTVERSLIRSSSAEVSKMERT